MEIIKNMNSFNKFYNLILQSIITQGRAYRTSLLQKVYPNYQKSRQDQNQIEYCLSWLQSNFDNKTGDLLCKFIANKSIKYTDAQDPSIQKVVRILKLQPSIDIQSFNGTMQQFIEKYNDILTKAQDKIAAKSTQVLDKIPQFTQKKEYDKGVVIYRVQESKKGQAAVRKIVDMQWGEDANPWCLISRNANSWDYWRRYSGYPKHIAFQNGKLLAFCANNEKRNKWWDRQDHSHLRLPLLDGTQMEVDTFEYSEEDKKNMMFIKLGVHYNDQTKRYDSEGNVEVLEEYIVDGHLPIPFGVINGDFICHGNDKIVTLNDGNQPTHIKGICNIGWNENLEDIGDLINRVDGYVDIHNLPLLKGKLNLSPQWKGQNIVKHYDLTLNKETNRWDYKKEGTCFFIWNEDLVDGHFPIPIGEVQGSFNCSECEDLTSLQNGPREVGGYYILRKNPNLRNLKGMAQTFSIEKSRFSHVEIEITECENLESLEGLPQKFSGQMSIKRCPKLASLQYLPKNKGYQLWIDECNSLTNLKGCPEEFYDLRILDCIGLTSLQGGPRKIIGIFNCSGCTNLTSLQNGPESVTNSYYCSRTGIKNLIGAPKKIIGEFECDRCKNLQSLQGGPEYVHYDFNCVRCPKLTSLQFAPEHIGGKVKCSGCKKLQLTDQDYKKYNIGVKRK